MTNQTNSDGQDVKIGAILRSSRETQQWTQAEVAQKLHLPQRVVIALETDKFNQHPGLIFMRGYLRAYCRLLNLPENDILKNFDALGLEAPNRPINVDSFLERKKSTLTERYWHLFSVGLFLLLLTLMLIWWWNHRTTDDTRYLPKLSSTHASSTLATVPEEHATNAQMLASEPSFDANDAELIAIFESNLLDEMNNAALSEEQFQLALAAADEQAPVALATSSTEGLAPIPTLAVADTVEPQLPPKSKPHHKARPRVDESTEIAIF